jgi:hypothetical protein
LVAGCAAVAFLVMLTVAGGIVGSVGITSQKPRLRAGTDPVRDCRYPSWGWRTRWSAAGLAKGLALFVALAIPGLCVTLLLHPHAPGVLPAALPQLAQWLSFGLVLGFAGDLRQLRTAGLGWRGLADVHNLTALTASLSTVTLALATAAAAALGTGAASVMVGRLLPPVPPAASAPTSK